MFDRPGVPYGDESCGTFREPVVFTFIGNIYALLMNFNAVSGGGRRSERALPEHHELSGMDNA